MLSINLFYVILGLFLGIMIVYVTNSPPKVVFKYPTIDNIVNTTFVDEQNRCYRYYAQEVACE